MEADRRLPHPHGFLQWYKTVFRFCQAVWTIFGRQLESLTFSPGCRTDAWHRRHSFIPNVGTTSMKLLYAFIGMPGWPEMLIICAVLLLLFGNRLPSVMRSMGKGISEFKRGIHDPDTSTTQVEDSSQPESTTAPSPDADNAADH